MAFDYTVRGGKPEIHLFARNISTKHQMVVGYRPYFYAPWEDCYQIAEEGPFPAVDHVMVGKIYTELPKDVPDMAKRYHAYEDKIPFPLRWLIDKGIKAAFQVEKDGVCKPIPDFHCPMTVFTIDTELEVVKRPNGKWSTIQDAMMGKQMIVSVCYEYEGQRTLITAKNELEEQRMLQQLVKDIRQYDPDVLTGWNVSFDLSCIINRCLHYGMDPHDISPMHYVDIREREIHVAGRNVFDLREGFRKYFQGRTFDSYALEDIAARTEFLGYPPDGFNYHEYMNRDNTAMIGPYNERDVDRTVKLNKMLDLINHFDGVRRVAGCRLQDSLNTSKYADIAMLRQYHGKYVLGTKGYKVDVQKVEGAMVLTPKRGVHKNVIMIDFAGMYPSIIMSNNISPECLCGPDSDAFEINGVYFKKRPWGVVPQTVEEFMNHRKSIKAEMKKYDRKHPLYKILDLRQYSIKQMIAAIYGFFGFPGSRLYYPQVAGSITAMGRKNMMKTVEFMKKQGFETIYGDTDSLLITVRGDMIEEGNRLEGMVNDFWKEEAARIEMHMPPVIEFEIGYSQVLLSAKKRYAGRCTYYKGRPTDEIIMKGFEARRSDSALISRQAQTDVLNMILNEKPEAEIRKYIRNIDVRSLPFEEVGIPDPLRKPPETYVNKASILHVFYSNMYLGKSFQEDSRPYVFYIKRVKPGMPANILLPMQNGQKKYYKVDRIALENEQDLKEWWDYIDWRTQAQKVLENKLEPILSAYGLSMSEVKSGQRQITLGEF
jgi:DNA polymerase elongation subunit (family B)